MSYTPLTDPFEITFNKDGVTHEAIVTYAKSTASCENFFDVNITKPAGFDPFYLKEKPANSPEAENMVWVDGNDKLTMLYQVIGDEIQKHLRKNLGIFLIDAPASDTGNEHDEGDKFL